MGGKIFATLGYPGEGFGVLMLTAEAQQEAMGRHPETFEAASGAWGRRGSTKVRLSEACPAQLRPWMELAWHKVADKRPRRSERIA